LIFVLGPIATVTAPAGTPKDVVDTYYFTARGHWELSHTITTNHLVRFTFKLKKLILLNFSKLSFFLAVVSDCHHQHFSFRLQCIFHSRTRAKAQISSTSNSRCNGIARQKGLIGIFNTARAGILSGSEILKSVKLDYSSIIASMIYIFK